MTPAPGGWPKIPLVPPDALPAWHSLLGALMDYAPPCAADPDLWHSDDAEEAEAACYRCQGCQVLTACGAYADAAKEPNGVWGGVNRKEPQPNQEKEVEAA